MPISKDLIAQIASTAPSRLELWAALLNQISPRTMAEVGVYRGKFARHVLDACPSVGTYYMVDPWRHLDDWNKPANKTDDTFEQIFDEAMSETAAHAAKRVVLRGRTTEVIDKIEDAGLDFAYIDGDHTLRGIAIDLVRTLPKIRPGGFIGGDDFRPSIWQHGRDYEPTLVFPFAVHFAEAVGARIYALPHKQFLMECTGADDFEFVDLTGRYEASDLRTQFQKRPDDSGSAGRTRRRFHLPTRGGSAGG